MMRLKKNCDLLSFLRTVKNCESDVYFYTQEGDQLNLKSTLSQYLFSMLSGNRLLLEHSHIECCSNDDLKKLVSFLDEEICSNQ